MWLHARRVLKLDGVCFSWCGILLYGVVYMCSGRGLKGVSFAPTPVRCVLQASQEEIAFCKYPRYTALECFVVSICDERPQARPPSLLARKRCATQGESGGRQSLCGQVLAQSLCGQVYVYLAWCCSKATEDHSTSLLKDPYGSMAHTLKAFPTGRPSVPPHRAAIYAPGSLTTPNGGRPLCAYRFRKALAMPGFIRS